MKKSCLILVLASFCFLSANPSYAQSEATKGVLRGAVRSEAGNVLAGVSVTIINQETGVQRRVQTDMFGAYVLPSLPVGNYQVVVERPGFTPTRLNGIV